MSILKALQKKRAEDPNGTDLFANPNVVPFDASNRRPNTPRTG